MVLIVLFVLLVGAALLQAVLGGNNRAPCGPETPGGLPSPGACVTPSPPAP
jgi:hypothetical protein